MKLCNTGLHNMFTLKSHVVGDVTCLHVNKYNMHIGFQSMWNGLSQRMSIILWQSAEIGYGIFSLNFPVLSSLIYSVWWNSLLRWIKPATEFNLCSRWCTEIPYFTWSLNRKALYFRKNVTTRVQSQAATTQQTFCCSSGWKKIIISGRKRLR
jgi:hypothetical protein